MGRARQFPLAFDNAVQEWPDLLDELLGFSAALRGNPCRAAAPGGRAAIGVRMLLRLCLCGWSQAGTLGFLKIPGIPQKPPVLLGAGGESRVPPSHSCSWGNLLFQGSGAGLGADRAMGDLAPPGDMGMMPSHPTRALLGLYKSVPAL